MSLNINLYPVASTVTISNSTTFGGANLVTFPVPAYSLQLLNQAAHAVTVQLNGLTSAEFPLAASGSVLIPPNSFAITSIDFANSSGSTDTVCYIAGLGAF